MKTPRFKICLISMCLMSVYIIPAWGEMIVDDPVEFTVNNPDGQKYEFVKAYIMGIEYIYQNEMVKKKVPAIDDNTLQDLRVVTKHKERLANANVNLRVARNLLKRFEKGNNALMIKVVMLFNEFVDDQVDLNNQERLFVTGLHESLINGSVSRFKRNWYVEGVQTLGEKRRDAFLKLLEASTLINKVLVSHEFDRQGHFYKLGITADERQALLNRVDHFEEEGFQGGPREGQTFLEASVTTIRQILEDKDWLNADNNI